MIRRIDRRIWIVAVATTLLLALQNFALDFIEFSWSPTSSCEEPMQRRTSPNESKTFESKIASMFHNEKRCSHPKKQPPAVALLMSFPNSGTTFTLKLIQATTQTTTATNYGGTEQVGYSTSIPVDFSRSEGPYFRWPERRVPRDLILTKTHCEPNRVNANITDFDVACRSGNRKINGTIFPTTYTAEKIKAAVHLIRSPFDNIVSRMNYKQRAWANSENEKEQMMARGINNNPQGFARWCQYLDYNSNKHQRKHFNASFWDEFLDPLPCHLEFFRYFHWHEMAFHTIRLQNLTVLTIYYEDYATLHNETVDKLLHFLRLKATAPAPEFIVGKTYLDFFSPEHADAVERLARAVSSKESWQLLNRYF